MFISFDPNSEEQISSIPFMSDSLVDRHLTQLNQSYFSWKAKSLKHRSEFLIPLAEYLKNNVESIAQLLSQEIGKPIAQSRGEVLKCADLCIHYLNQAPQYLQELNHEVDGIQAKVVFQPLGIVLGIMPWNFPLWQVFRFTIPTILAGNVVAIKHAPNSGMSALLLQEMFDAVGLKEVYCNLIIDLTQTERLIEDLRVKGVSLTGSSRAGSAVGKIAGANLKPVLLELGGSDVFIVEDDVNVHEVVKFAISARLQNNGQSCIAAKRFLISESVFESFKKELIDALQDVKIGDPLNEQVGLGPLARLDLKQGFEHQLIKSKEVGAKSVFVKVHGQAKGFYVNLEVLELEDENNSLFKEEVFGPCFVLKKIKDLDEAISIANNSIYGLSASIWTSNREKQNKAILGIESGAVFVNAVSRSYAGLPFGGIKQSGMGRELGEEGIKAFVNKKLVVIA